MVFGSVSWDHEQSRHERGYGYRWTKLRANVLRRDDYLCQPCIKQGRVTPANEVDHITPKSKDGTDDYDNLQAICTLCHKAKTKREATHSKRPTFGIDGWPMKDDVKRWGYSIPAGVKPSSIPVVLVSGPPAAGKTTYVKKHAKPGDIIIDLDEYKVKAGGTLWDTAPSIWSRAFRMRDEAIRSLAHKQGCTCYLIVTAPTAKERETWRQALVDVEVVVIDTPQDICERRIKEDPRRRFAANNQVEAVRAWWRANSER